METSNHEDGVTMLDVLQDIVQQEVAVQTILSKDESKECSYQKGYTEQTLFGCLTCAKEAGICLGCYLTCHLDHETFEIGVKKNFRCDCGNDKFENQCLLKQSKDSLNSNNKYDHNFQNRFCQCNGPYYESEFMIRCIHCEDYFHLDHLGFSENEQNFLQNNEEYTFMICFKCHNEKFKFLEAYKADEHVARIIPELAEDGEPKPVSVSKPENKEETNANEALLSKRHRSKDYDCKLEEAGVELDKIANMEKGGFFLKDNWGDNICLCEDCIRMYKTLDIYDLISSREEKDELEVVINPISNQTDEVEIRDETPIDPVMKIAPETAFVSVYENAMKEMTKLDYSTQSQIASIYRDFYDDFIGYFHKFSEQQQIITPDNIKEFFDHLKEKKKPSYRVKHHKILYYDFLDDLVSTKLKP